MKKIIAFLAIDFFMFPFFALADGLILPPPDYYMYETDQRAVIFYENGYETLVLSSNFRGDAKNFGWVVPTPSRPQVSRASDEIFTSLEELTRVESEIIARPMNWQEAYSLGVQKDSVYVIENKKIEYYDITVLAANDAQALSKWLRDNNYQMPSNSSYVFDSYINNGWFFTAVKIDTSAISPMISRQLREGHMVPLKLGFTSQKIVFPLKISSLMQNLPRVMFEGSAIEKDGRMLEPSYYYPDYYPNSVGVLIYVFTPENKQTLPGFKTQYAGWVKKETIENLAFDENGNSWISPTKDKYFLTKLTRWMSASEMSDDLYLRNAADNNLVNASPLEEKTNVWFWIAMGVSTALIFGTGITIFVLSRK